MWNAVGQAFLSDCFQPETPDMHVMSSASTISFRRRHLPHWMVADRSYFVTLRLKGSLPRSVVEELMRERMALMNTAPNDGQIDEFRRLQFKRVEAVLDSLQEGPRFLDIAPVADIVLSAFRWLEEQKGWIVHAMTVMPNHVHALLRNVNGRNHCLNQDIGVLKGFTARQANTVLKRTGRAFWADENFDHWRRDDSKLHSVARYIAMNPVEAGLVKDWRDWPWTRVGQAFLPDLMGSGKNAQPTKAESGKNVQPTEIEKDTAL